MIYTEMTKKALKISFEAHKNQLDKSGMPYIYHPFHLAEQAQNENETIVALLHDVIEDTNYTLEDLKHVGFSNDVIEAVSLLTHDKSINYMDYIAKIKNNPLAVAIKLKDLRHNSDLSRLDVVDGKTVKRVQKYSEAFQLLFGEEINIENISFCCYNEENASLYGRIFNGCLYLDSCVYGEEYNSEKHYLFSKENSVKLFSFVSLNEFIVLCKNKAVFGMELFLKENQISYNSIVI